MTIYSSSSRLYSAKLVVSRRVIEPTRNDNKCRLKICSAEYEQIASLSHTIPGSHKTKVSVRTLERFMANYRKDNWEGLKPKKRPQKNAIALPAPVLQKAIELRRERPERSVEQIIYLLEHSGMASRGRSTKSSVHLIRR